MSLDVKRLGTLLLLCAALVAIGPGCRRRSGEAQPTVNVASEHDFIMTESDEQLIAELAPRAKPVDTGVKVVAPDPQNKDLAEARLRIAELRQMNEFFQKCFQLTPSPDVTLDGFRTYLRRNNLLNLRNLIDSKKIVVIPDKGYLLAYCTNECTDPGSAKTDPKTGKTDYASAVPALLNGEVKFFKKEDLDLEVRRQQLTQVLVSFLFYRKETPVDQRDFKGFLRYCKTNVTPSVYNRLADKAQQRVADPRIPMTGAEERKQPNSSPSVIIVCEAKFDLEKKAYFACTDRGGCEFVPPAKVKALLDEEEK